MTWTWLQFNGDPFDNHAPAPHVVVAAPKEVAVEWFEDTYGVNPERVTDDDIAWTLTEKQDPDQIAVFIVGEVTYGGVGAERTRDAELSDLRQSDAVRVVMPKEMSAWGRDHDVDPKTPERPFVPSFVDLPEDARTAPSPFKRVRRDEDNRGPDRNT